MRIVLSEDHTMPIVSVALSYEAGSIHEPEDKTGLAVMIENLMMFHGSRNVGPMQHINFLNRIGGRFNATTTADKTTFLQTVPTNQLALVLWLESDRMNSLHITRENVEQVKQTLLRDIFERKATNPYLGPSMTFDQWIFSDFEYNHPISGYDFHIRKLRQRDVIEFYRTFYTPNNAVLSIVGDIDPERTRQLVELYFQTIPSGPKLPDWPAKALKEMNENEQYSEETAANSPGLFLGYRLCSPMANDFSPLVLCEYLLIKGITSRLYKRLVTRDRYASHISGGIVIRKDRAIFRIFAVINNERNRERSHRAILSEINRFRSNLVSAKELAKAKALIKSDFQNRLSTTAGRAVYYAETLFSGANLENSNNELIKYLSVTTNSIKITADRYFSKANVILDVKIK
ncbi:M16 family metallopeptidase [Acidobacteriota bacterium]